MTEMEEMHQLLEYFEKYEYDYYPDNALMGALLERGTVYEIFAAYHAIGDYLQKKEARGLDVHIYPILYFSGLRQEDLEDEFRYSEYPYPKGYTHGTEGWSRLLEEDLPVTQSEELGNYEGREMDQELIPLRYFKGLDKHMSRLYGPTKAHGYYIKDDSGIYEKEIADGMTESQRFLVGIIVGMQQLHSPAGAPEPRALSAYLAPFLDGWVTFNPGAARSRGDTTYTAYATPFGAHEYRLGPSEPDGTYY